MQLMLMQLCMVIFLAIGCGQHDGQAANADEIPYRVLKSHVRHDPLGFASYIISVDRLLDRPQIEQLICQIVRNEKPDSYSILGISIYYKLDKWYGTIGIQNDNNQLREYGIANYSWNKSLQDQQKRLMIWRDVKGNFMDPPKFYDFDHSKACK